MPIGPVRGAVQFAQALAQRCASSGSWVTSARSATATACGSRLPGRPATTSDVMPVARRRERRLGGGLVAASITAHVHRRVAEQARASCRPCELLDDRTAQGGSLRAASARLTLLHAQRRAGAHLSVDVGLGDVVEVDQHPPRHAAARQRLGGPRAHAAQADHGTRAAQDARSARRRTAAQARQAALEVPRDRR